MRWALASAVLSSLLAAVAPAAANCGATTEMLGLEELGRVPIDKAAVDAEEYTLRGHMLRFHADSREGAAGLAAEGNDVARFAEDVLVLYHAPTADIRSRLDTIYKNLDITMGAPFEDRRCDYALPGAVAMYAPFASRKPDGTYFIDSIVQVYRRTVYIQETRQRFDLDEPAADTAESGPEDFVANEYPWLRAKDFMPPAGGGPVFAADKVECSVRGVFVVGSQGDAAAGGSEDGTATVSRGHMIAANVYHGASGRPNDPVAVAASYDDTAYWCVPRREVCYQTVAFGDFGIVARAGESIEFPLGRIASIRHGIPEALQWIAMENCSASPTKASVSAQEVNKVK